MRPTALLSTQWVRVVAFLLLLLPLLRMKFQQGVAIDAAASDETGQLLGGVARSFANRILSVRRWICSCKQVEADVLVSVEVKYLWRMSGKRKHALCSTLTNPQHKEHRQLSGYLTA